jgi:actin-like ATPase involved in cell morphogenesis
MGYLLGIDLGTTYSAAAVCRPSGDRWAEPEMVTLGSRSASVPSVLYLGADGSVVVGEAAERRALTDPDRVVREFKRRIGDPTPLVVAGVPWAAEELAAQLVSWIVAQVATREGGAADGIAVSHPAAWGRHKKDLLAGALAGHGLTVTFLAEPEAAAMHYASAERVGTGSTIAVYDLGGGTFDSAVVRKGGSGFDLLGRPEGIERLGGIDFDQVVFDHVVEAMPDAFAELDDTNADVLAAVARIRRECTEAKETLSADTEASVPVLLPGTQGSVRLHRSEFEQLIGPHVEETVAALRRAVGSAGLTPEMLDAVLLVGGSSRIPLVAQLVSEQLDRPVAVDADPKNSIAKGAVLAVAPQPSMSWPAVEMAPVETTAPIPVVSAASAAALVPAAGAGPAPWFEAAPVDVRPVAHVAPPRPPVQPLPDWTRDELDEPRERRGPVGLLIGAGAALGIAAIAAAVLTWPTARPASAGSTVTGPLSTASAPAEPGAVSPAANPVAEQPAAGNNAAQTKPPAAGPAGPGAPAAPVVPPAPLGTTVPPPVVTDPSTPPPATEGTPSDPPPVTDPPVTNPPVTDPPVTDPPVTNPPVTNPPVSEPPPASQPPVVVPPPSAEVPAP